MNGSRLLPVVFFALVLVAVVIGLLIGGGSGKPEPVDYRPVVTETVKTMSLPERCKLVLDELTYDDEGEKEFVATIGDPVAAVYTYVIIRDDMSFPSLASFGDKVLNRIGAGKGFITPTGNEICGYLTAHHNGLEFYGCTDNYREENRDRRCTSWNCNGKRSMELSEFECIMAHSMAMVHGKKGGPPLCHKVEMGGEGENAHYIFVFPDGAERELFYPSL